MTYVGVWCNTGASTQRDLVPARAHSKVPVPDAREGWALPSSI